MKIEYKKQKLKSLQVQSSLKTNPNRRKSGKFNVIKSGMFEI